MAVSTGRFVVVDEGQGSWDEFCTVSILSGSPGRWLMLTTDAAGTTFGYRMVKLRPQYRLLHGVDRHRHVVAGVPVVPPGSINWIFDMQHKHKWEPDAATIPTLIAEGMAYACPRVYATDAAYCCGCCGNCCGGIMICRGR